MKLHYSTLSVDGFIHTSVCARLSVLSLMKFEGFVVVLEETERGHWNKNEW